MAEYSSEILLVRGQRAVDLMVRQPGDGVAYAKLAHQRERREGSLRLTDQLDGQELGGQGQLSIKLPAVNEA